MSSQNNFKRKIVPVMEKTGRYQFSQVIKVNIISNGIKWNHVPPLSMHWEDQSISSIFPLSKICNLNLIMSSVQFNQRNPVEGHSIKNWPINWPITFLKYIGHEFQGKIRNCSNWKRLKIVIQNTECKVWFCARSFSYKSIH